MRLNIVLNLFVVSHGLRLPSYTKEEKFKALIFHADNRPVNQQDPSQVTIDDMSFVEMAAMVDYRYAEKHGYEFRHFVLPESVSHPTFGKRHIAWAKFLAIKIAGDALPDADILLLHDSDTAVSNHAPSLPEFMDAFTPATFDWESWDEATENQKKERDTQDDLTRSCNPVTMGKNEMSELKEKSSIWLNQGCRGHFVLMKPKNKEAWAILQKAWNFPEKHFQLEFPWEQAAWDHLSIQRTPGLLQLAGVNRTHGCDSIQLDHFNQHMCHFQSDTMAMSNSGDEEARDRMRADLGCGEDWENKCTNNTAYRDAVDHHDFSKSYRKLVFLDILRKNGLDDEEIHGLYRKMRASVVELKEDDLKAAAAQLYEAPELHLDLAKANVYVQSGEDDFKAMLDRLKLARPGEHTIPKDSRARKCWCDNA